MSRIPPKKIRGPKKPQAYHTVPSRPNRSSPPTPIARQMPSSFSQNPLPSSSSIVPPFRGFRVFGLRPVRASPRGDEVPQSRLGRRGESRLWRRHPLPAPRERGREPQQERGNRGQEPEH